MRAWLAVLVLACACVQSHEVPCADGRLCAAGNTCDDANHRCLSPEQTAACDGHAEGDACTLTAIAGVCQGGVCEPLICGDGIRTDPERCDGTDLGGATCKDAGFYEADGLGCTPFCTFDTKHCTGFCGDHIVQPQELCDGSPPAATCVDDGFDAGALGCSDACGASFASCGRFGWRPEPTGLDFLASVAGRRSDDVWACGGSLAFGQIAHFDGSSWSVVATVAGHTLNRIVEVDPDDVWAIDSTSSAPAIVHVVGGQPAIVTGIPAGAYEDLLALGANDVYVATSNVGVLHWNGATWQPVGALAPAATPCSFCEMTIAGTGASDLWVIQTDGTLVHWDGAAWRPSGLDVRARRLSAPAPNDAWVTSGGTSPNVVAHWTGTAWTKFPALPHPLTEIVARADNDVWVTSSSGRVSHFDGIAWTASESSVTPATTTGFSALAQVGPQIIGGTGDGFILRYDGMMVARYDTLIPNPSEGIWSRRPDDTWLATNVEVWHYDGIGWTNTLAATSQRLKGVYGTAADDVWTWANDGSVYHFDGATWAVQPSLHFAGSAMWGVSPTDLWFFGITAMHFDGTMALDTFIPPATFNCASGTGSADIWAATQAAAAEIYHWDGVGWTLAYTAPSGIRALAAVAPGEVFAFGNDRRVYQLSGNVWHTTLLPAIGLLVAGAATAPDDVFAATPTEIFHFDGARWSPVRAPNDPQLASDPIAHIDAHPGYVDFLYFDNTGSNQVRRLVRTRPWDCAVTETVCGDGVDNDCDGLVDGNDPDCP